jgi:sugar O-acyltransferase (sialic acid O-acetyltransferase NeuD family)
MKKYIIIGASGHAKVIAESLVSCNQSIDFFVDDDKSLIGSNLHNIPVKCTVLEAKKYSKDTVQFIIGIGNNDIRRNIYNDFYKNHFTFFNAIHSTAVISPSCQIEQGVAVMANAVVNAGSIIKQNTIINTSSSIDHDCFIDAHVHIAPGVHVCGGVQIGTGSLIGVGASVVPGVHIGKNVVVGAGAAVIEDIPDNSRVKGVPARVIS